MKSRRLLSLLLAAAMVCTTMFTGCSGNDAPSTEAKEEQKQETTTEKPAEEKKEETKSEGGKEMAAVQELVAVTSSDAVTLDTALSGTIPDQKAQAPLTEGLTRRVLNEDGVLEDVPAGAESWDISEDKTVYTFHLRKEAKWSDGTPVTSADHLYAWRRTFTPEIASPSAWMLQDYLLNADACMKGEKPIEELGVKAIDDYTFEVTLAKPFPLFLTYAGFNFVRPLKQGFVEQFGTTYGSSVDKFLGNGPFVLKSWEIDSKMEYEPNPYYWNAENVHLTKVTRQIIKETSTLAQALMSNEVDVAGMDDPDWNAAVDATGMYTVHESPNMDLEYFIFNCEKPQLSNPKIRLAISLAVDRQRYSDEVYNGKNVPAYSMGPDISTVGNEIYHEVAGDKNYLIKELSAKYPDPKALLLEGMEEAGLGSDPSTIEVHYYTRGTTELSKKSAEWLKQEIESKLGIKLIIELTEWNIMYDLIDSGDYEMAQGAWSVDTSLEPSEFLKIFDTYDGYYNAEKTHWVSDSTERYHELVNQMLTEQDPQKLTEIYLEAENIIVGEAPVSPVFNTKARTLVGNYVEGYMVHSFLQPDYIGVYLTER